MYLYVEHNHHLHNCDMCSYRAHFRSTEKSSEKQRALKGEQGRGGGGRWVAGHWKCSLSPWLLSPHTGPSSKRVKVSVSDQQSSATAADGTSA